MRARVPLLMIMKIGSVDMKMKKTRMRMMTKRRRMKRRRTRRRTRTRRSRGKAGIEGPMLVTSVKGVRRLVWEQGRAGQRVNSG